MTHKTIFLRHSDYETSPTMTGEWFIATRALENKCLEHLDIATKTGATVLACRNGLWNSELEKQDIEIFLWGTTDELAAAQAQFKLQPLIDRQLDCPEIYWG